MDKNVFKKISYGLYIVSSNFDNTLSGCIVNTVSQITSVNPLIAVSINKNNYTNAIIKKSQKLSISILSSQTKKELINRFGFASSKDVDKFKDTQYEIINDVAVVTEDSCGYIIGDIVNIIDAETHDIFLIRVSESQMLNDEEALTYQEYQNKMKGSSPKNAPTYIEPVISKTITNKYRCLICGHIYDDGYEKIPFSELPDDWVCPVCGVGKDKFEKIN